MSADLEHELREMGARLLADAPPVTTAEVLEHRRGDVAIVNAAPVEVPVMVREITSPRSAGRWRWTAAIGTAAAAAVIAVGVGMTARDGKNEPQSVGAAPTTSLEIASVAEASASTALDPTATDAAAPLPPDAELAWPPRVLLDDSWDVVTASERSVDEGYVSFERDGVIVFVNWYRGPAVGAEWDPRDGTAVGPAILLGRDVTTYSAALAYRAGDVAALVEEGVVTDERIVAEAGSYDPGAMIGGPVLEEALAEAIADGRIQGEPTQGLQTGFVENASSLSVQVMTADATTLTEAEFVELLAGLRQFAPADWVGAMPDRVVTPDEREAVIAELTADVPLPEGWGLRAVSDAALTQDRIDVAGFVAQSVSCAWVTQYFSAEAGSAPAIEALEAIATIPSWPATQELVASWDHEEPGVIPTPNNGAVDVSVDGDTLMYNGEPLDGFFAAQLCDMNAVG